MTRHTSRVNAPPDPCRASGVQLFDRPVTRPRPAAARLHAAARRFLCGPNAVPAGADGGDLLDTTRRHAFVFAHQDDELPYAGLLQRLRDQSRYVWLTNGDGLAPEAGADPAAYAEMRLAETTTALKNAGLDRVPRYDLRESEIGIYDGFIDVGRGGEFARRALDDFADRFVRFERALIADPADVYWTLAYQGGQPEHDLTSAMTLLHLRRRRARGDRVQLVHLPEYEFTILVPLRFKPWYGGPVASIRLTDAERNNKAALARGYPSQVALFERFRRVIGRIGRLTAWAGGPRSLEDYMSTETFSPVDLDFDPRVNPHFFEFENYVFERHRDVKVRWDTMVGVIVRELYRRFDPASRA